MNFRTRLFAAFLLAVMVPIIALALIVRHEMTERLTAQYSDRIASRIETIEKEMAELNSRIERSITVVHRAALEDNRFRRAAVDRSREERHYLLDYAGSVMRLSGLTMLQIQDSEGRIVSSGHFRNEYDRIDRRLPLLLRSASGRPVIVAMRTPDAPFLALARMDSLRMGEHRFTIVAGIAIDPRMLHPLSGQEELTVSFVYPDGARDPAGGDGDRAGAGSADETAAGALIRDLEMPFIRLSRAGLEPARIRVTHGMTGLHLLRRSVNRWFLLATAAAVLFALALAIWLSSRISRPLAALAARTEQIDLDRLDIDFSSNRRDEIGVLSRGLARMTGRLRASTVQVKDAERRAALGDLARQVNHDIKNALTPIRNIVRHLTLTGRENPAELADVLAERQGTLESGIDYLEQLAGNYARLSPRRSRGVCDLAPIITAVARDLQSTADITLQVACEPGTLVAGDPVSLRRIFENIMRNAVESCDRRTGRVAVRCTRVEEERPGRIRITVTDNGSGMEEAIRSRIFNDFYTTKTEGTGLGLSIVRRLVMDLEGAVRVESEPGTGSRFIVELPAASRGDDSGGQRG